MQDIFICTLKLGSNGVLLVEGPIRVFTLKPFFELVCLNLFTEAGESTHIHNARHSGPRQWTHFLVMWTEMMLLHHAKYHFVLASIHAAAVVAKWFLTSRSFHAIAKLFSTHMSELGLR